MNTVSAKSHELDFPIFWWHMYLRNRLVMGGINSFFYHWFHFVHLYMSMFTLWKESHWVYLMLWYLSIIQSSLTNLILQKTLPVTVAVVEQLGGALGESGLLVLPCIAAHIIQVSRQYPILGFACANSIIIFNHLTHLNLNADNNWFISCELLDPEGPVIHCLWFFIWYCHQQLESLSLLINWYDFPTE